MEKELQEAEEDVTDQYMRSEVNNTNISGTDVTLKANFVR
jgi:hypothetical protein